MVSIITGDIINSRKVNTEEWLPDLKSYFETIGTNPKYWEIYRGDSFQVQVDVKNTLKTILIIKSLIKKNKKIDVRMAIGMGEINYQAERITESNGPAFINSGESFSLLKKTNLNIKTPFPELNEYFETILQLIAKISDDWKPITSETIFYNLFHPELNQKEISEKFNKSPSSISEALKRGGYHEISQAINLFQNKIEQYV